jgi:transcriptional regulator GlxA family with amidase domain
MSPKVTSTRPSRSLRRVLIIAPAPAQLLDLAGPAEVFAQAGRLLALSNGGSGQLGTFAPLYRVEVAVVPAQGQPDQPATTSGVRLAAGPSLADLVADRRPLDTLIAAGGEGARSRAEEPELRAAVRQLASRAERVASVCTGAFVLAAAGLLDGKRTATHWRWCDRLARSYPSVRVEPEPIFTRDGDLWTSAGVTAGIDLALALVEEDHGHALALAIARELVMFLRRPGGQAQFSTALAAQAAPNASLRDLVAWIADNLHRPLTVDVLAARACLSPRHFARIFSRELGVSPGRMVDRMRVEAARRRLEDGPEGLATVAAVCGFGSEEAMRRAFLRHLGTPPGAYRERFRCPPAVLRASLIPAEPRNEAAHP